MSTTNQPTAQISGQDLVKAYLNWQSTPAQQQADFCDAEDRPVRVSRAFCANFRGIPVEVYEGSGTISFGIVGGLVPGMTFYGIRIGNNPLNVTTSMSKDSSAFYILRQIEIAATSPLIAKALPGTNAQVAFDVKDGDVVSHDSFPPGEYVVEAANTEVADAKFAHRVQRVQARKLDAAGNYDPNGSTIEFTLGKKGCYLDTIDHVIKTGEMQKQLNYV